MHTGQGKKFLLHGFYYLKSIRHFRVYIGLQLLNFQRLSWELDWYKAYLFILHQNNSDLQPRKSDLT